MNTSRDVRLPLMVTSAEGEAIDAWRYANKVPSRAEAIRRLIACGLQQSDAAPAGARAPTRQQPPDEVPVNLGHVRPYPAREIASKPAELDQAMNVRLPVRLKMQLEWLTEARRSKLRNQVEILLQDGVDRELEKLGIQSVPAKKAASGSGNDQPPRTIPSA